MGYSTFFVGEITITPEPSAKLIAFIQNYYNEVDDRLDLEFSRGFETLVHNGAEKSRTDVENVQRFIDTVTTNFSDVVFNGTLQAAGEEYDDRWLLIVKNNKVMREEQILTGKKVTCPHCDEEFRLDD